MKKSTSEYVTALSDDNFEILEDIFTNKYRKFVQLYWLISGYSDYISSLSYKETKKEVLKVDLTLAKLKVDKVMEELSEAINDDSCILIWNDKKIIHIEITRNESVSE